MSEAQISARQDYRTRIQQRQTIIFGSIGGVMVLTLIVALLIWSGIVPAPYDPGFSGVSKNGSELVTPCVPDDTQAVEMNAIAVNVYNSTSRNGLAGQVGQQLGAMGVAVVGTDNWSQQSLPESARIITGQRGVASAYTIAQYIPGSVVQYDPDVPDEVLSIVLGEDFSELKSAETVAADNPGGILTSQDQCTVIGKGKAG